MDSNLSVSKGIFVYKNGAKAASHKSKRGSQMPEKLFSNSLWYQTYKSLWNTIESQIEELNDNMFSQVLSSLVQYIKSSYSNVVTEIPTAALLTGINMPDHFDQFRTLKQEIQKHVTPHVVILNAEDCQNLKYLVEALINGLVKSDIDEDNEDTHKIKKSQCSFTLLQSWYEDLYLTKVVKSPKKHKTKPTKKNLVVVIPDFEKFPARVLQDFILITSCYVNVLPFVFVFGVATALNAIHRSLPCHVSSKINLQVFRSSASVVHLNNILENVLFSSQCPFHLGGSVFNLFTDMFLFYDLSVTGFIRNFKYAMLEHFSYGNAMALCQSKTIKHVLAQFTHEDLENVRHLLSFRDLVEKHVPEIRIKLLTDDEFFRIVLNKEIFKIMNYLPNLHLFLKCLHTLVGDLPKAPLGKQVRELYAVAVSKNITQTQEYVECFQLLSFQSREELCNKVSKIRDFIVNNSGETSLEKCTIDALLKRLTSYVNKLNNFEESDTEDEVEVISEQMDRQQLKEQLLQLFKKNKMNKYEVLRSKILDFLSKQFEIYLLKPSNFYFHEIFFFNDLSIQNHIIGSQRTAIHTALNDPYCYLQCSCCQISNDSVILSSMPDISIVYKLHLECGKMINLYDWLQSFISIVNPQEVEEAKPKVNPQLQARFSQAVAELEYLGFIKSSKRKTDHVARLTWGG